MRSGLIGFVLVTLAAAITVVSCSSGQTPQAIRPASSPTSISDLLYAIPPSEYPKIPDVKVQGAPQRGSCVSIDQGGGPSGFKIRGCDSGHAEYRVIQIATQPDECVIDADRRYFSAANTHFTLCMDYNWNAKNCIQIGPAASVRAVACSPQHGRTVYRVDGVIEGGTDLGACPGLLGFTHNYRKFTICVKKQTA